jgi:hypothetical protein
VRAMSVIGINTYLVVGQQRELVNPSRIHPTGGSYLLSEYCLAMSS